LHLNKKYNRNENSTNFEGYMKRFRTTPAQERRKEVAP